MWETSEGWKLDVFSPYLSQETLKQIQAYELKEDPTIEDLVYWQGNSKGKFTIKSAIRIMRHESDVIDDVAWNAVWSAPVQQRIRAFPWLVCHDRVLGNLNRFKRRMTDDSKCYICGAEEESTLHIIRDYAATRMIWRKIGGLAHKPEFFMIPLKQWLTNNLHGEEAQDGKCTLGSLYGGYGVGGISLYLIEVPKSLLIQMPSYKYRSMKPDGLF